MSNVDRVKERLGIVELISGYVELSPAGSNLKARCPFHNERTPSFMVSPERGTYKCFGCGKGGDIFSFFEEIEGLEFKEALVLLAERAGVELEFDKGSNEAGNNAKLRAVLEAAAGFYQEELKKNEAAKSYLKERGVKGETALLFRIGFAPDKWSDMYEALKKRGFTDKDMNDAGLLQKGDRGYYDRFRGRVMFPISDSFGKVIGFSARLLPGSDSKMGKYINSPETKLFKKSRVFYGLHLAKASVREQDRLILVEGQMDVIMSHQAGVKNIVATSGTAVTEEHVKQITRLTDNLSLMLDPDEAGFKAAYKTVTMALSHGLYVSAIASPEGSDPAELAKDPAGFMELVAENQDFIDYAIAFIRGELDSKRLEKRQLNKALGEYIHPYVAAMYNEIEKDEALSKVADHFDIDKESVRRDYEKWQERRVASERFAPASAPGNTDMANDRLSMLASTLAGFILWKKDDLLQKEFRRLTGHDPGPFLGSRGVKESDAIFEAERDDHDGRELLKQLEKETLLKDQKDLQAQISSLEKGGGSLPAGQAGKELEEALKKHQELSRKIHEL